MKPVFKEKYVKVLHVYYPAMENHIYMIKLTAL